MARTAAAPHAAQRRRMLSAGATTSAPALKPAYRAHTAATGGFLWASSPSRRVGTGHARKALAASQVHCLPHQGWVSHFPEYARLPGNSGAVMRADPSPGVLKLSFLFYPAQILRQGCPPPINGAPGSPRVFMRACYQVASQEASSTCGKHLPKSVSSMWFLYPRQLPS